MKNLIKQLLTSSSMPLEVLTGFPNAHQAYFSSKKEPGSLGLLPHLYKSNHLHHKFKNNAPQYSFAVVK